MIRFYRVFTIIFCLIGVIYILFEIVGLVEGNSSLNNPEDLSILIFIIIAIYLSFSFSLETRKLKKKEKNHFEVLDVMKIKNSLNKNTFNKISLYGNLTIGVLIVLSMVLVFLSDPLEDFLDDYFRLISIIIIVVYGLIQIHFSLIVKKKLEKENS